MIHSLLLKYLTPSTALFFRTNNPFDFRHPSTLTIPSSNICIQYLGQVEFAFHVTITTMDCFQDCCLFCDRDSPDGPYCSQQCRMADMEKASLSNPGSPTSPSSFRADPKRDSRFQLSPAYNFHQEFRTPGYDAPAAAESKRPRSSYFLWSTPSHQHERTSSEERSLSPSSSRTSLSSTTSTSSITSRTGYLPQTKKELQDYYSLLDQARASKRKSSTR